MRRKDMKIVLGLCLIAVAAPGQVGPNGMPLRPPPPPDTTHMHQQADQARDAALMPLKISYGKKSAEWTAPKLAELPHESITVHNGHTNTDQTFSGVPLIELLTQLGVPEKPKGKDFRLYLVAEGRDGYKVVYSIGEVTPDVHEATVLLADAMYGKHLTEGGPLKLV